MENRVRNITVIAMAAIICSFCSGFVVAADEEEGKDAVLVHSIVGDVSEDGKLLTISLTPGEVATYAIRVFSEPSHVLLMAVIDSDFATKADAWRNSWIELEKPMALVTTDLPDGLARVHVPARPANDNRIAVYVYGSWPDGSVGEILVSDARVGQGSFAFSTSITAGDGTRDFGLWEHCCQGGSCPLKCVTCESKAFDCCLLDGCCWIECGWGLPHCTCAECDC